MLLLVYTEYHIAESTSVKGCSPLDKPQVKFARLTQDKYNSVIANSSNVDPNTIYIVTGDNDVISGIYLGATRVAGNNIPVKDTADKLSSQLTQMQKDVESSLSKIKTQVTDLQTAVTQIQTTLDSAFSITDNSVTSKLPLTVTAG